MFRNQNADSPGAVRLRQSGDIFRRLVPSDPAGVATSGRDIERRLRSYDLDGGKADETVLFGLDGTTYEIDLSKKNAAKLRDALAGYVGSARRVSGRRGGAAGRARGRGRSASDSADIRAWAKENGYEVSERGRISAEVRAAYNEAK
jgi:hypothetical protein